MTESIVIEKKELKVDEIKALAGGKNCPVLNPFVRWEGLDASANEITEAINRPVIRGSRLLWLSESAVTV